MPEHWAQPQAKQSTGGLLPSGRIRLGNGRKFWHFLIQSALAVQGHDAGKPDGSMGPNTMMALVKWYTRNREPGLPGIAQAVAHLLHDTLTAIGLAPGPRDGMLGWRSRAALKPWDRTFGRSAMIIETSEDVARRWIMEGFGKTPSADAEESGNQAAGREPAGGSNASHQSTHECVKFSWWEKTPFCDDHIAGLGNAGGLPTQVDILKGNNPPHRTTLVWDIPHDWASHA